MHHDDTAPAHDLKSHTQVGIGGLACMTAWWFCSCGWESSREVGFVGYGLVEAAATAHATEHGTAFPGLPDKLTPDEATRLGRAMARVLSAAWRATSARAAADEPPMLTAPKPKRQRKPDPSRLAKWEAAWQADAPEGDR